MRLLHLADVHLGATFATFGEIAERRRNEHLAAFRRLPTVAAEHGVDAVLVVGDLFEGPRPGMSERAAVTEVFSKLASDGRPVFVVPGNHDSPLFYPNPWSEPWGASHAFLEPAFGDPVSTDTTNGPLHVYGFAHDAARQPDPLSTYRRAPKDGMHVVLIHGSVRDSPHWAPSRSTLSLLPEELWRLEADYVALGDHHRFRPPAELGLGRCSCYPGSFAGLDSSEIGPRGFVIADLAADRPPRIEHRTSGVAPIAAHEPIDVGECADGAAVIEACVALGVEGTVPIFTLEGSTSFALDVEEIAAALCRRFGHARVFDLTSFISNGRLDRLAEEDTVAGHLVRSGRLRAENAADEREKRLVDRAMRIALRRLGIG